MNVERNSKRLTLSADDAGQRWPRITWHCKQAAILSTGEATGMLRDWARGIHSGGCEAVAHYGGPRAVLASVLRHRSMRGRYWRKRKSDALLADMGMSHYSHRVPGDLRLYYASEQAAREAARNTGGKFVVTTPNCVWRVDVPTAELAEVA